VYISLNSKKIVAVFSLLIVGVGLARADEGSDHCYKEASDSHRQCLRENRNDEDGRNNCNTRLYQSRNECRALEEQNRQVQEQADRANRGETTGIGNFTPVPQRQSYVLPGSR
jgi:hypothetical protein